MSHDCATHDAESHNGRVTLLGLGDESRRQIDSSFATPGFDDGDGVYVRLLRSRWPVPPTPDTSRPGLNEIRSVVLLI